MKRMIVIIMVLVLVFVFAACGSDEEVITADGGNDGTLDGGWAIADSPVITDELAALFNKAFEGMTGAEYTPVAFISSQIVAGRNYLFLARTAPVVQDPVDTVDTYALVTIYEDLEGNAEVTNVQSTDIGTNINGLMGGWEQAESPEVTDELREYFTKACEPLTGADYEPIALTSQQVVAGMNYSLFCRSTLVTPGQEERYAIVIMYVDLDGNASISDIYDFEEASGEAFATEIINPFIEATDLEDAAKLAGFEFTVPESMEGYPEIRIEAMENYMIQVFYHDGEPEDEGYKDVLVRKANGTDDISGDYNEYAETETVNMNGAEVTLKGDNGLVNVASWTKDGYTYAIDASEGLAKDKIEEMVELIK